MSKKQGIIPNGTKVEIVNKKSPYYNFWGFIQHFDGRWYHVGGGCIGDIQPVFSRRELRVMKRVELWESIKSIS